MDIFTKHAVSDSAKLRKQELECLRLEAHCRYLANNVESPDLKTHFTAMAKRWSNLAVLGPAYGYEGQDLH